MMHKEDKIHEKVEKSMRSLEGIQRAQTDDFFYERLIERLHNENEEPRRDATSIGFVLAAAAVIILLLVNVFTIREYRQSYGDQTMRQENLNAFAKEYQDQVETPTIYELNTQ